MHADGAFDVFQYLNLSGEPLIPELVPELGKSPRPPLPLLDSYDNVLRLKEYRDQYADYWESTAANTRSGIINPSALIQAMIEWAVNLQ